MKNFLKYYILLPLLLFVGDSYAQVETIGLTVRDVRASSIFFTKVLGFVKTKELTIAGVKTVSLKLGNESINLTQFLKFKGRPVPADMKSNDLYFQHIAIVVSDMDKAYALLKKYEIEGISTQPQTIPKSNAAGAGIRAYYFYDPDHHDLELIWFPKGKGQPKWQKPDGKLFLGIDHTAIGIGNTAKSLHFYKDLLGLTVKGESWNKGIEQEHLSGVKGASLHITDLASESGPGIELLQYLVPGPGKPYPKNTKTQDCWYWQITLATNHFNKVQQKLAEEHYRFRTNNEKKPYRNFVVLDPDGHALLIKNVQGH